MALNYVPLCWKPSAFCFMPGSYIFICFYVYFFFSGDCFSARSASVFTAACRCANHCTRLYFVLNNITVLCNNKNPLSVVYLLSFYFRFPLFVLSQQLTFRLAKSAKTHRITRCIQKFPKYTNKNYYVLPGSYSAPSPSK
jgi:hypothetical protein